MQKVIEPWSFTMKVYYIKNMFVQSSHKMKTGRSEMIENNTWKEYINFSIVSFLCPVIILGTYLESPKYILTFPFLLFLFLNQNSSLQEVHLFVSWYLNNILVRPIENNLEISFHCKVISEISFHRLILILAYT